MKKLALIVSVLFLIAGTGLAQFKPQENKKPLTPEEIEARDSLAIACDRNLDHFAGNWISKYEKDGKPVVTTLSFKRVINRLFLSGEMITVDLEGNKIFESHVMLSFNPGAMNYLYSTFESDGWSRMFVGQTNPEKVILQGYTPKGYEFWSWTRQGKNVHFSHWNPSKEMPNPNTTDPDSTIVFKPF